MKLDAQSKTSKHPAQSFCLREGAKGYGSSKERVASRDSFSQKQRLVAVRVTDNGLMNLNRQRNPGNGLVLDPALRPTSRSSCGSRQPLS